MVTRLHHVNVTVPPELEAATRNFYGAVVGLEQVPKPAVAVSDLVAAEKGFREAGVEIIPDPRPMPGTPRFYVRDPGGNQLEIVQASV